jgi:hypothetical protein
LRPGLIDILPSDVLWHRPGVSSWMVSACRKGSRHAGPNLRRPNVNASAADSPVNRPTTLLLALSLKSVPLKAARRNSSTGLPQYMHIAVTGWPGAVCISASASGPSPRPPTTRSVPVIMGLSACGSIRREANQVLCSSRPPRPKSSCLAQRPLKPRSRRHQFWRGSAAVNEIAQASSA